MARLVYALNSGGRGHTFRAMAMAQTLRERGHEVVFCCGGVAKASFEARGERVLGVPALNPVIRGNRGHYGRTVLLNAQPFLFGFDVPRLVDALADLEPDLLISDFEPFATRAAELMQLPVLALNRQQVVTEARYTLPGRFRISAALTRAAIRYLAPSNPEHLVLPTFSRLTLKHPTKGTLVAPIVRGAVASQIPTRGEHLLVYYNHANTGHLLELLGQVNQTFTVYTSSPTPTPPPNIELKHPAAGTFEADLASCRGVICTAGFTLMSEALFLGKPLLVHPNQRFFEQTLNALLLVRAGLGHACFGRVLSVPNLEAFIAALPSFQAQPFEPGNVSAAAVIEGCVYEQQPRLWARPALHRDRTPSA